MKPKYLETKFKIIATTPAGRECEIEETDSFPTEDVILRAVTQHIEHTGVKIDSVEIKKVYSVKY